ncbi:hypothetical protein K3495_g17472 [Podosphaera aphanis]|nr:hypothetical protein K3495_g17472 [Podosphaera aphanis]
MPPLPIPIATPVTPPTPNPEFLSSSTRSSRGSPNTLGL